MAEYIALVRMAQLFTVPFIGLACIYFGYRLFLQIPVTVTNDGSFKMPKVGEVKLKAAPGVFFALFGVAIIYFSIDRSINISAELPANQAHAGSSEPQATAKASKGQIPFSFSNRSPGSTFSYSQSAQPQKPQGQ